MEPPKERPRAGQDRQQWIPRTPPYQLPLGFEPEPTIGVSKQLNEPRLLEGRPVTRQE